MSNELENTNFSFRSTRPFERVERSSELENWAQGRNGGESEMWNNQAIWFVDSCRYYTGAPIVGIARWSVPRIGQGHLEVKW